MALMVIDRISPAMFVAIPQVATILGSIMDRGSDHIIEHLLEACGFVDWLIGAPSTVVATPAKGDPK